MDFYETLRRWQELSATIKKLKDEERALREGLFNGIFPDPEEGTNDFQLEDGRTVKGVYKINRRVLASKVNGLRPELKKKVLKLKYSLSVSDYRKLSDSERKEVDAILSISPGLPSLDVVEPKPSSEEVAP